MLLLIEEEEEEEEDEDEYSEEDDGDSGKSLFSLALVCNNSTTFLSMLQLMACEKLHYLCLPESI